MSVLGWPTHSGGLAFANRLRAEVRPTPIVGKSHTDESDRGRSQQDVLIRYEHEERVATVERNEDDKAGPARQARGRDALNPHRREEQFLGWGHGRIHEGSCLRGEFSEDIEQQFVRLAGRCAANRLGVRTRVGPAICRGSPLAQRTPHRRSGRSDQPLDIAPAAACGLVAATLV